jgi:hypothetical protein
LAHDRSGLELRNDPAALAPERLLVFEVRGSITDFAQAVQRIGGLELVDEQELESDESDQAPVAYLLVPDIRALEQLLSLWQRWLRGQNLDWGQTRWRDVFGLLRDLRPWGPQDRVQQVDANFLREEVEGRGDDELVQLEVELVYRKAPEVAQQQQQEIERAVLAHGGRVISRAKIDEIAYHALLVDLPVAAVRRIAERSTDSIAALEPILHIRPQSVASSIEVVEAEDGRKVAPGQPSGSPILALLDGVPVQAHRLLRDYLSVDDQFELEKDVPVDERRHGTAMASLIIYGDLNRNELPLTRKIHVVPILGPGEQFPGNKLIIDVIYSAILRMRQGKDAIAPDVIIVNLSVANRRRPFSRTLSAWARLLDRLAYQYGLLFIVSAGNCRDQFAIPAYQTSSMFEDDEPENRARETLKALGNIVADRRLFSPAETVNGLTVGACNIDAVSSEDRKLARVIVDPYKERIMSNPSSALGPGFALAVKPDILLPGAREHLRVVDNDPHIFVVPASPGRANGLRVATPPSDGRENLEGFTNGTSAAAALASRTAHRIHDALAAAYGDQFLGLSAIERAVLLKALLAHTAKWPEDTADFIRGVIGPLGGRHHARQKDNIRRFLGFGIVDPEEAIACADDRATFWATGFLRPNKCVRVEVPIPSVISGQPRPHALSATLAWFTPTAVGRKNYRTVRLKLNEPDGLEDLGVRPHRAQPDYNQTNRGTLFMRRWTGDRAPVVGENAFVRLIIQRERDLGPIVDEPIPFGLAVTLTMPGVVGIYEEVRQRLGLAIRLTA